ncbi:hypothetical protein VNI00_018241 [Paramarasmius palmivorus]|uniref:Transposase n=1 Tax=Paramarasmius palmivorus TaxID=297713 RepID=A0AAW0B147_9AGAR
MEGRRQTQQGKSSRSQERFASRQYLTSPSETLTPPSRGLWSTLLPLHQTRMAGTKFRKDHSVPSAQPMKREESAVPEAVTVHPYTPGTGNTNMRKHLVAAHFPEWIDDCDARGIPVTADCAANKAKLYRDKNNRPDPTVSLEFASFSIEGLVDCLMELIVKDDLPISLVESESFVRLILYLKRDLREKDILGRTTMRKVIIQAWYLHMHEIAKEFEAIKYLLRRIGIEKDVAISRRITLLTMTLWSNILASHFKAIDVEFDAHKNHMRCFAHILHLAVTPILEERWTT